jgi:hypothetical protein
MFNLADLVSILLFSGSDVQEHGKNSPDQGSEAMQSSPIKHSQFLMGFMAGQQEKIVHGIEASGFAKVLDSKQATAGTTPASQATAPAPASTQSLDIPGFTTKDRLFKYSDLVKSMVTNIMKGSDAVKKAESFLSSPASQVPLSLEQWDQAQKLSITDPMTLDKVLTQLNLPAETRDACKNAENRKGGISLKELGVLLSQAKLPPGSSLQDGKAALADVQTLLASLRLNKNDMLQKVDNPRLKESGTYNLVEFRKLLHTVIRQTANDQLKQTLEHPAQAKSIPAKAVRESRGPSSTTYAAQLASETVSLASNIIPSFIKDDDGKHAKKAASFKPVSFIHEASKSAIKEAENTFGDNRPDDTKTMNPSAVVGSSGDVRAAYTAAASSESKGDVLQTEYDSRHKPIVSKFVHRFLSSILPVMEAAGIQPAAAAGGLANKTGAATQPADRAISVIT